MTNTDDQTHGTFTKYSPIDGTPIGTFPITTAKEVHEVVTLARAVSQKWSSMTLNARFKCLKRLRNVCLEKAEIITQKISLDTGKPYFEGVALEVLTVIDAIDYYLSTAKDVLARQKRRTPILFPGKSSYVEYFPLGVVGVIAPWNFPFQLAMMPVITALITGNTVVLKPSELAPITGEYIKELFEEAQMPTGIVQVIQGDSTTGKALAESHIDKIFFTGSTETGKKVMASAAKNLTQVSLELGGKDPFIVLKDANLERAAGAAVWGALANTGQVCTSVERIFVEEDVYDAFVAQVKTRMETLTVGKPSLNADIGPMITEQQLLKVEKQITDAVANGATVLLGGKRLDTPGYWLEPTLITNVTDDMAIFKEETFGPVVAISCVASAQEAISRANDSQYGLAASIWTSNYEQGLRYASKLEAGQVSVNDVIQSVGNMVLPFGGAKSSGMGRYHGPEGLLAFVQTRAIMSDRGWINKEVAWFPYEEKYPPMLRALRRFKGGSMAKAVVPMIQIFNRTK